MINLAVCKNCENSCQTNYCSNCGQKQFQRINRSYIINSLQETVIQTHRGFLYTLKSLIKDPGKMARQYIDGKRMVHYKPLPLVFLLATISAFISYKLLKMQDASIKMNEKLYGKNEIHTTMAEFVGNYTPVIMLLSIPVIALTSHWAFKKYGDNYYEHIIMQAYYQSLVIIFSILIITPINYVLSDQPLLIGLVTALFMFVSFIGYIWFWVGIYPQLELFTIIKRTALQMVYSILILIGLFILGIASGFFYAMYMDT